MHKIIRYFNYQFIYLRLTDNIIKKTLKLKDLKSISSAETHLIKGLRTED